MIKDTDVEQLTWSNNLFGDFYICLAGFKIAGRMIVA